MDSPKWPDSLPPFTEITKEKSRVYLTPSNFKNNQAIQDLVHDLYWFSDTLFFLYFRYEKGIGQQLNNILVENGISLKKTEMYFYKHPNPGYENDFIRVLPHEEVPSWKKEASKGEMYGRIKLSLSPEYRKQLDFKQTAEETSRLISNQESIIEIKPGIGGISFNVKLFFQRLIKWLFPKRKR